MGVGSHDTPHHKLTSRQSNHMEHHTFNSLHYTWLHTAHHLNNWLFINQFTRHTTFSTHFMTNGSNSTTHQLTSWQLVHTAHNIFNSLHGNRFKRNITFLNNFKATGLRLLFKEQWCCCELKYSYVNIKTEEDFWNHMGFSLKL